MQSRARILAATAAAVFTLIVLGFPGSAFAASVLLSPTVSSVPAQGPVLTEEDDEPGDNNDSKESDDDSDGGGGRSKKKKVIVGGGISATLLAIAGFVFRWSRRAHKAYKIGRSAVRAGRRVQQFRQDRRGGDDQPPAGYRR